MLQPTQAGARIDDDKQPAPFHGPSTSALYVMTRNGATIRTEQRPAMFMTRADTRLGWGGCRTADHQPNTSPFTHGLSPYWLSTQVQLAPDNGVPRLENVVRLTASIKSEDTHHDHFSSALVAYLQHDFTQVYSYNLAKNAMTARPGDAYTTKDPVIRCTADDAYCMGMYVRPKVLGKSAYYYTMTRPPNDYNGMTGEYTMQVTSPTTDVDRGDVVRYETYVVVGNRDRVGSTIRHLHRAIG